MTVIIGIDPHKWSHTAVAPGEDDRVLGQLRVAAGPGQIDRLLAFAASRPERIWAVENANGLGRLLARQLVDTGQTVFDVPARLAAQVRALSGAGHKTDAHEARSTTIACRHAKALRPVVVDGDTVLLGLFVERRHQIASQRRKTLCRIYDQLIVLVAGGCRHHLTATRTALELHRIRPPIRSGWNARRSHGSCSRSFGCWTASAGQRTTAHRSARPVRHNTDVDPEDCRGRSRHHHRRRRGRHQVPHRSRVRDLQGTAPIAASSGDKVRYRLNRGGQRDLNRVLHTAAKTQRRLDGARPRLHPAAPRGGQDARGGNSCPQAPRVQRRLLHPACRPAGTGVRGGQAGGVVRSLDRHNEPSPRIVGHSPDIDGPYFRLQGRHTAYVTRPDTAAPEARFARTLDTEGLRRTAPPTSSSGT